MKKIIAVVLTCVLVITSIPCAAFAEDIGNNGIFGVITNAKGEVVEVIPMPRAVYLDKTFTLSPGDTLTTYQYEPNSYFFAGFSFCNRNNEWTTRNGTVLIELFGSSTIGGDGKTLLKKYTFSTNLEDNWNNPYFGDAEGYAVALDAIPTRTMRYFNAVYTNKSSFTINLNVFVGMD